MFVSTVLFILILVLAVASIGILNRLVALGNAARKAWANVDVLLMQRHDELPKLVEICKYYMKYERETIERVLEARGALYMANQAGNLQELGTAEGALRTRLGSLFAAAEAYPELKASTLFIQLQRRISGLESSIADGREFYNDAVNCSNTAREQFPAAVIAYMFDFRPFELFEFDADAGVDVDPQAPLSAAQVRAGN